MTHDPLLTWYNPIGDSAYVENKVPGELRIRTRREYGSGFKVTGFLRIRRNAQNPGEFLVHSTVFGPGSANIEKTLTASELRMMFNCKRENDANNDVAYALRFHATYARQGLFIRHKGKISFPCPGTGLDGDPNFCFHLIPEMIQMVESLIENGTVS